MRIRKRQVPFPLLPVTHSDPNLINRSPVMVQLNDATKASCTHHGSTTAPSPLLDLPQPSDQPLPPIGKPTNGSDESSGEGGTQYMRHQHKRQEESLVEDGRRKEEGEGQKGNDTRKGSISCSETPAETFSSPSPPKQDGRWWCEGDKAFPLKKRRGAFENAMEDNNNNDNDNDNDDNDKKNNSKLKMKRMKTKMNKKCSRQDDSNEEEEVENEEEATRETKPEQANVGNKKRVRGGALMEGSRCSRVNGRGWRCCQQTLVGYSLCEHHLGKGRLRSMTSVRNKSIGTSSTSTTTTSGAPKNNNMPQSEDSSKNQTTTKSSSEDPLGNDAENNDDEKKPVMVTKRRMKLGMVKARSISSLLGQTNTEIIAIAEDNNDSQ